MGYASPRPRRSCLAGSCGRRLAGLAAPTDGTGGGDHARRPDRAGADRPQASFRVATFNIHGCTGADGRRDVDRAADCLRDLDFVALNEVHGPRLWEKEDQAALLGRRLGMQWLFAPATRDWQHIEFGNGLLTTLAVESWQRLPLAADNGRGCRNAVVVRLRRQGQTISVLLTHINRGDDHARQRQLRQAANLYLALPPPSILLGDLNSEAAEPEVRRLLAAPGVINAVGRKAERDQAGRIHWIFVRGLRVLAAGLRDNGASDHPLAWAEVTAE